jgi:MYXO-CTERM domain-containing protein
MNVARRAGGHLGRADGAQEDGVESAELVPARSSVWALLGLALTGLVVRRRRRS